MECVRIRYLPKPVFTNQRIFFLRCFKSPNSFISDTQLEDRQIFSPRYQELECSDCSDDRYHTSAANLWKRSSVPSHIGLQEMLFKVGRNGVITIFELDAMVNYVKLVYARMGTLKIHKNPFKPSGITLPL